MPVLPFVHLSRKLASERSCQGPLTRRPRNRWARVGVNAQGAVWRQPVLSGATPPPPTPPDLFSKELAASGAAGSGTPSGADDPQSTPASPAALEETGGTDDEQDEDPEEEAWLGPNDDGAESGWDEQNKAINDRTIAFNKAISINLLDWDMQMQLGQIRARDPHILKNHQERIAMTPPGAPVSVLVKATHSMSCLP